MAAFSGASAPETSHQVEKIMLTLETLVKPPDSSDKVTTVLSSIKNNIAKAVIICGEENLKHWTVLNYNVLPTFETENASWEWVCICLSSLLRLKQIMLETNKEILISVNQKGIIKSSLQFVNALGISPFLKPGIGISCESRSRSLSQSLLSLKEDVPDLIQLRKLSAVVRVLGKLIEDKSWVLYSVILSTVITDFLSALIQLSWGPKLSSVSQEEGNKNSKEFRFLCGKIMEATHQPTLIRELMVCLNPQPVPSQQTPPPAWYIRSCSKLLTKCLLAPRGVISTVRALHDLSHSEDNQNRRYDTTAKLLLGPHGPKPGDYYLHLCLQLLELLKSDNIEYRNVAAQTVKCLWTQQPDFCEKQILEHLWKPFEIELSASEGNLVLEKCQEENLLLSIQAILALTSPDGIPVDSLLPALPHFCTFYQAIWQCGGTPQLRNITKELFSQIMTHSEHEESWKLILGLQQDCLLTLTTDTSIANVIFTNLLHFLHKSTDIEEKVMYCQLLMLIAEIPSVQKLCLQKPNLMLINTIKSFLEDCDLDMVPVALLLLGTMVAECDDFSQYQNLVPALQKLRKSTGLTESLRAIAEEIISSIATFGAVNMDQLSTSKKEEILRKPETPSIGDARQANVASNPLEMISLQQALEEIQDSEIPTRGHGFLAVTKLLRKRDKATLNASEQLFSSCLLGLQHEDSYVYLAAVGALSALTLNSLDHSLLRVTQNYCQVEHGPTLRTRLGEVLLQVCKGLGEMAGKYGATLLHAFLAVTKDASPAMRTSSLSNLGEACRILGFQVNSELQEILMCAHCLATTDEEMEVRRAAALLMTMLLRGLGTQAVSVLGSCALELYRGIKQLALSEDETLSLQAQLALEELTHGIKEGIFTPQLLEKKIYITSPPP